MINNKCALSKHLWPELTYYNGHKKTDLAGGINKQIKGKGQDICTRMFLLGFPSCFYFYLFYLFFCNLLACMTFAKYTNTWTDK